MCPITTAVQCVYGQDNKGGKSRTRSLNEMMFADDQSLTNEDEKKLQKHTNSLNITCEEFDMKISISKVKVKVKVSRTPSNFNLNGTIDTCIMLEI